MGENRQRWVMHLDMDAFFAAVEQRDYPEYRGRPVVVGARPGGRGVVATCSYEARVFGIRSAMPIAEAYRRCPDAIYLRPDGIRYAEASRKVMAELKQISPLVEQVSVDEAYVDISGLQRLFGTPLEIGRLAKQRIQQAVALSCSVGIGPNRLIAKLASDHQKPDGLTLVPPEQVQAFLDPMPVANLRGVGKQILKSVHRLGIRKVAQLRELTMEQLARHFGENLGTHLYRQARGMASDQVGHDQGRKSISKETTFGEDQTDQKRLRERLRSLASQVAAIARREQLKGRVVTLKIRLPGFETHTRQTRLPEPVDQDIPIFKTAWSLYQGSGHVGKPVRLIGVGISGWDDAAPIQDLFSDITMDERAERLYNTLDAVTERFGKGKLSLGMEPGEKE